MVPAVRGCSGRERRWSCRHVIDWLSVPRRLCGKYSETNWTPPDYYAQPTPNEAFSLLRSRTEDAGVFVLLKGDLGSYHTAIPVDVFRGFAIADDVAPFVVINDQDSTPAWSFTLLHELVHLLLGQTGISGANPGTGTEETLQQRCRGVVAACEGTRTDRD